MQEIMARLEEMQLENAALHDKVSVLKQQRGMGDAVSDGEKNYATEIELTKSKVAAAEQETVILKKELSALIKQQEELQRKIETEKAILSGSLAPVLKHEEMITQAFYERLLQKFEEIPDVEVTLLKELVTTVQKKRKAVADETEENQRISRLIKFNKARNSEGGAVSGSDKPADNEKRTSDVFENPLPCTDMTPAKRRGRRRVTFPAKRSSAVLD